MPNTYRIAVLGGDGTGPEVVREGMKVLDAAALACSSISSSRDIVSHPSH